MQVLLNTDTHVDGRQAMAAHLDTVVREALERFRDHVTRVEAHIVDANAQASSHSDQIQCTLEARLAHLDPVVVKDHAATAHQAIDGALGKLKRALATRVERHDAHRNGTPAPQSTDND